MLFRTKAVPTSPTNIKTLLDDATSGCKGIALQAPSTNAAVVNFGDQGQQPGFVPAGSSTDVMPINRLSDLYIVGTSGDSVIVMVF